MIFVGFTAVMPGLRRLLAFEFLSQCFYRVELEDKLVSEKAE